MVISIIIRTKQRSQIIPLIESTDFLITPKKRHTTSQQK